DLGTARQWRWDLRGAHRLWERDLSLFRGDRGPERGPEARPGDGEPLRHGLGAAWQRRRELRGQDRLRHRWVSELRGDRGPERGREARPGDGEPCFQYRFGAA